MQRPTPGDAHNRLAALVGQWIGRETLHPSPWELTGGVATTRVANRWVADGFAVHHDYQQRRNGKVTFRGHGVFWFDPASEQFVMHWWDSLGGAAGEYRGGFEGDRLVLVSRLPQPGRSRTSWTFDGPDAHTFRMEVAPDDEQWQVAIEGSYRRRGTAAPVTRDDPTLAAKSRVLMGARARTGIKVGTTAVAARTPSPGRAKNTRTSRAGRRRGFGQR